MKIKPLTMKALARVEVNARQGRQYLVQDANEVVLMDNNGLIACLVETVYKFRRENQELKKQLAGGR